MSPTRWHPDRKPKLPQPPPTAIPEPDAMNSSRNASQTRKELPAKSPATSDFVNNIIRHLIHLKDQLVSPELLRDLRITTTRLDFFTGRSSNPRIPALVRLRDLDALHADLERVKPWIEEGKDKTSYYYEYRPRYDGVITEHNTAVEENSREARYLSQHVYTYIQSAEVRGCPETVLDQTSWLHCIDEPALQYLGSRTNPKYLWWVEETYFNYQGRPPQTYAMIPAKHKPHGICQINDSTPFLGDCIRTSELQTVALVALSRHLLREYKHLDYFGVTVLSFWDRQVRVVQGLVNFKTNAIELRVSPVQSFETGMRSSPEQYKKFLALLAYFGDAGELPGF